MILILVEALAHCQGNRGLQIYAWVILDNHFHAMVAAPELSRTMAAIKRRTAWQLVEQLEATGRT